MAPLKKTSTSVAKKTNNFSSTTRPDNGRLSLTAASEHTLYEQTDKLEFFVPSKNIEAADTPTSAYIVSFPVTDPQNNLRVAKIKSVRAYIWNRGPQDLYMEVLQPFGAHGNSGTIVAWGPVRGRRNKPQVRWTVKANKSGGSFKLDVSDNNFTLPATIKVSNGTQTFLNLACFGFAVTRNAVSFTGEKDSDSSRSLQFKIVVDYWGVRPNYTVNACLVKGLYSDLGAVQSYPKKVADDIYHQMGLAPLSHITGYPDTVTEYVRCTLRKGMYVDTNSTYDLDSSQSLYYLRVPDHFGNLLTHHGARKYPIAPVSGLLWKTDDNNYKDNILGTGYGNVIVQRENIPDFQQPRSDGWFVCQEYYNEISKQYHMAPLLHMDPNTDHDVLNNFMRTQYAHCSRIISFDRMIAYNDSWALARQNYMSLFSASKFDRQIVSSKRAVSSSVGGFSVFTFIEIVTIIIKVIEAGYTAYAKFTVSNAARAFDDVGKLPGHKPFAIEDSFEVLQFEDS